MSLLQELRMAWPSPRRTSSGRAPASQAALGARCWGLAAVRSRPARSRAQTCMASTGRTPMRRRKHQVWLNARLACCLAPGPPASLSFTTGAMPARCHLPAGADQDSKHAVPGRPVSSGRGGGQPGQPAAALAGRCAVWAGGPPAGALWRHALRVAPAIWRPAHLARLQVQAERISMLSFKACIVFLAVCSARHEHSFKTRRRA